MDILLSSLSFLYNIISASAVISQSLCRSSISLSRVYVYPFSSKPFSSLFLRDSMRSVKDWTDLTERVQPSIFFTSFQKWWIPVKITGWLFVLCAHHQLGKIPRRKRQAPDAGERPSESCGRWRISGCQCFPSPAEGDRHLGQQTVFIRSLLNGFSFCNFQE